MSARARRGPRDGRAQWLAPLWCLSAALGVLRTPASQAFNLDVDKLTVYSGPEGSYFGYAVDFHIPAARTASVLVGAPKANTSQPDIVEGGAVYYCPWPAEGSAQCKQIPFDNTNNRKIRVNGTKEPIEFKSNQWFGATVKAHRGEVVACAPLYHWRTLKPTPEKDPVGTCYVAIQNFSAYAEYSPCRNSNADPEGQGYCQAGFSLDFYKNGDLIVGGPGSFYWQGQVITASIADIIANYSFKDILRKLAREKQTDVAPASYDDSYLGYSVAAGEFTGDSEQELVAGVPRGAQNFGYMASYFGYTVTVSDVNNDGMDDVLIGAPLFMEREFETSPREVGQVYLYLQVSALVFRDPQILSGTEVFGRFGSAVAHLGDLNQDGYNDIAIGAPFAGKDQRGQVLIYNGNKDGLHTKASQILQGLWASQTIPSGFGFTLRGDSDIDKNDYPESRRKIRKEIPSFSQNICISVCYVLDIVLGGQWQGVHCHYLPRADILDLIVGAFGTGKVAVYRARPVVTVDAQLLLHPMIINLENKTCQIPESVSPVACGLTAEVYLDTLKQKGAVKRTLFLDNNQSHFIFPLTIKRQKSLQCQDFVVYLRDETEFRDKLSPINISLNYSLDESTFKEGLDVKPILNYYKENTVTEQAHILVDCGEDNMCIPDLKLSARPDKYQVIIGDENHLMLVINARNEGEGAYEAELFVMIPEEADYVGIERSNKGLRPLSCEYKMENTSRMVVCDLGNPMVAGTNYSLGLRFAVPRLEKTNMSINFDLQIRSSNKDNPDSNFVSLQINITAVAQVEIRGLVNIWVVSKFGAINNKPARGIHIQVFVGVFVFTNGVELYGKVSHPPQIVLPVPNWEPEEELHKEEGVGPVVEHIYELHNIGPSTISDTLLEVGWPFSARDEFLLYIFHIQTLGPLQCQTNPDINPLDIKPATPPEDTPELSAFLRNSTIPHLVRKRDVRVPEPHRQSPAKILELYKYRVLTNLLRGGATRGRRKRRPKSQITVMGQDLPPVKNDPYSLASLVSFKVKKMPYQDQPAKLPEGSIGIKTSVIWATPNVSFSIPLWVIILAILLGLLVLAILTLALWKCGFFDRARPPQDDMNDREQLTDEKTIET
ncbi:integrin alpha-8 isoform X1 [Prionailurus iriomotensis]